MLWFVSPCPLRCFLNVDIQSHMSQEWDERLVLFSSVSFQINSPRKTLHAVLTPTSVRYFCQSCCEVYFKSSRQSSCEVSFKSSCQYSCEVSFKSSRQSYCEVSFKSSHQSSRRVSREYIVRFLTIFSPGFSPMCPVTYAIRRSQRKHVCSAACQQFD